MFKKQTAFLRVIDYSLSKLVQSAPPYTVYLGRAECWGGGEEEVVFSLFN